MATAAKIVYSHMTKDPGVRGGRACIDNTRIAVVDVVAAVEDGKSVEEVRALYPALNLAQVYAAISYYHENKEEISAELSEDEGSEDEHQRRKSEYLSRRQVR